MASLTIPQLSALSTIDPDLALLLKSTPYPPEPDYTDHPSAIAQMRNMITRFNDPTPHPLVTETTLPFPSRDAHPLHLLLFHPTQTHFPPPLLVYFHGGGCTIGSPSNLAPLAQMLASTLHIAVACPSYRLAPEFSFPINVHDAWDALVWIASHMQTLGVDPKKGFLLGGVSAGGNFASVLAHKARDEGLLPKLTGVMLSAHQCLPPGVVPEDYRGRYLSRGDPRCVDAPVLSRGAKAMFEEALRADERDEEFAAFNWGTGHKGLPRTYLQVCGMDVNRDEALIYEGVLRGEGAETRLDVYPGMPHIFWSVFREHRLTEKWRGDTLEGVKWLLGRGGKL